MTGRRIYLCRSRRTRNRRRRKCRFPPPFLVRPGWLRGRFDKGLQRKCLTARYLRALAVNDVSPGKCRKAVLTEVGAGESEYTPPTGVILRNPGGAVGGAAPAAPGQAEELGGQVGCAAAIHGGVAASTCGGHWAAAGGHPGTASAAVPHSEPAAQFQSSPWEPTCDHP